MSATATALSGVIVSIVKPKLMDMLRKRLGNKTAEVVDEIAGPIADKIAPKYEGSDDLPREEIRQEAEIILGEGWAEELISYHETIKADAASDSFLQRNWRPVNGWFFAIECLSLIWTFCYLMITGATQTIAEAALAYGFLGTVLGAHAGVVGYYVHARTKEKTGT